MRTPFGSIGTRGFSLRTIIPGLRYQHRWGQKNKEESVKRVPSSIKRALEASEELSNLDLSLNENGVPKIFAEMVESFNHVKLVSDGAGGIKLIAEGMDTEDGTALVALNELVQLHQSLTFLKKKIRTTMKGMQVAGQSTESHEKIMIMMSHQFLAINKVEKYIKKALNIS